MVKDNLPKSWEDQRKAKLSPEEQVKELKRELKDSKYLVSELNQRLDHLRVSRRVLMNLLEKVEREKYAEVHRLEKLLDLERSQKSRVSKNHPLWALQKPPSFDEVADKLLADHPNNYDVIPEAQGIRENAKTIRAEFQAEEAMELKQAERTRLKKLSKTQQRV